jgi:hypothetical protein
MLRSIVIGAGLTALLAAVDPAVPPVDPPAVPSSPAPSPAPSTAQVVPAPTATSSASGQIRGTISYGRREPAVGAIVVVRPETEASPVRAATTGTSGTFAFDGLPEGTYRAYVRRDGYAPVVKSGIKVKAPFRAVVEVLLARGETPHEPVAAVTGTASLSGTIRVATGAPLAEAKIRLTKLDGADDARTALTTGAGVFAFPRLVAGRWRLDAQGAGLLPLRAELDLVGDVALEAQLAAQPANYRPLPQDLLVPEEVIPPPMP